MGAGVGVRVGVGVGAGVCVATGVGETFGVGVGLGELDGGGGPPFGGSVDGTTGELPPDEHPAQMLQKTKTRTERRTPNPFCDHDEADKPCNTNMPESGKSKRCLQRRVRYTPAQDLPALRE